MSMLTKVYLWRNGGFGSCKAKASYTKSRIAPTENSTSNKIPTMLACRALLAVAVVAASAQAFSPVAPATLRAAKPAALAGSRSGLLGRVVAPMARQAPQRAATKTSINMAVALPAGTPLKVGIAGKPRSLPLVPFFPRLLCTA
jgi:hypothetical protein